MENNGIIFGDDYWISDVKKAVDEFAEEQKLLVHNNHPFWFVEKKLNLSKAFFWYDKHLNTVPNRGVKFDAFPKYYLVLNTLVRTRIHV